MTRAKVGARAVRGRKGVVELVVGGRTIEAVRCREGSARVSNGQVEFTADVRTAIWHDEPTRPAAKKESK